MPPAESVLTPRAASSEQGPDKPHIGSVSACRQGQGDGPYMPPSCETWATPFAGLQTGLNPALLRTGILGSIQADGGRLWI